MEEKGIKIITKVYSQVFPLYLIAKIGNENAQYEVGRRFYYGGRYNGVGVKKSPRKAFKWFLKSARGGYAKSVYMLARCFEEGTGVRRDFNAAFECYETAAAMGVIQGMVIVAQYHTLGECVEQSIEEAKKWLKKAIDLEENDVTLDYVASGWIPDGYDFDPRKMFAFWKSMAQYDLDELNKITG